MAIVAGVFVLIAQIVGQAIATFFGTRAAALINRETQRLVELDKSHRDWRKAQVEPLVQAVNTRYAMHTEAMQTLAREDIDRLTSLLNDLEAGSGYAQDVAYLAIASPAVVNAYVAFAQADGRFIRAMRAERLGRIVGEPDSVVIALRESAVALHRAVEDYVFES